jgi:predicted RNase H-like nuclease (RuvC/YqgF family)
VASDCSWLATRDVELEARVEDLEEEGEDLLERIELAERRRLVFDGVCRGYLDRGYELAEEKRVLALKVQGLQDDLDQEKEKEKSARLGKEKLEDRTAELEEEKAKNGRLRRELAKERRKNETNKDAMRQLEQIKRMWAGFSALMDGSGGSGGSGERVVAVKNEDV